MRRIPPTKASILTGEIRNNPPPDWYSEKAGTFCANCRIIYNYEQSKKLLLRCKESGSKRGPRCLYCGKIVRTRSKMSAVSGFWNRIEEERKNGII